MATLTQASLAAAEVAAACGGTLVAGDASVRVSAVAPLDRAGPGDLSFISHGKYASVFATSNAGVVLCTPDLAETPGKPAVRIVVAKPHDALIALLPRIYVAPAFEPGVHPTAVVGAGAVIDPSARVDAYAVIGAGVTIGPRTWIGPHAVLDDGVTIGEDTRLFSHVTLYSGASIGNRTVVHAGTRIGSDGYGFVYQNGAHRKIPHIGRCIIGNDIEIGANCTIDRGSIDDTMIGDGTKIDNLVHLAHNVRVGRLCLILAQVGVAGSSKIEDGAILAGQAGVSGHHTVGKGATIAARAAVFGDVPAGETWSGYPARPHREALKAQATLHRLTGLLKRIEKMLAREPE
jgi:UDP-3-O-[3-hydroxymyristoyl] glucosamine N-acyltransferase